MNYEKTRELVKNIIENEFEHVQSLRESEFEERDLIQKQLTQTSREIFEELRGSLSEEQEKLLFDLEFAITDEWTNFCRFYFKEGIKAGLVNLKFLKLIDYIGCYIE